jgi:hypothetical protein
MRLFCLVEGDEGLNFSGAAVGESESDPRTQFDNGGSSALIARDEDNALHAFEVLPLDRFTRRVNENGHDVLPVPHVIVKVNSICESVVRGRTKRVRNVGIAFRRPSALFDHCLATLFRGRSNSPIRNHSRMTSTKLRDVAEQIVHRRLSI